jgi:hypothetical protein
MAQPDIQVAEARRQRRPGHVLASAQRRLWQQCRELIDQLQFPGPRQTRRPGRQRNPGRTLERAIAARAKRIAEIEGDLAAQAKGFASATVREKLKAKPSIQG